MFAAVKRFRVRRRDQAARGADDQAELLDLRIVAHEPLEIVEDQSIGQQQFFRETVQVHFAAQEPAREFGHRFIGHMNAGFVGFAHAKQAQVRFRFDIEADLLGALCVLLGPFAEVQKIEQAHLTRRIAQHLLCDRLAVEFKDIGRGPILAAILHRRVEVKHEGNDDHHDDDTQEPFLMTANRSEHRDLENRARNVAVGGMAGQTQKIQRQSVPARKRLPEPRFPLACFGQWFLLAWLRYDRRHSQAS